MKPSESFWRTIPLQARLGFLLGVFFIFSTMGFANDILEMGTQPMLRFVLNVLLAGISAMGYAASGIVLRRQFWKAALPVFALHMILLNLIMHNIPNMPQRIPMGASDLARLQNRLAIDGLATIIAIGLGYACFVYVSVSEGRRYAHVHAEMVLATEIHRVLVPAINKTIDDFDFFGLSLPSGEVGGDLIDVFQHDRGWIAYIADVSGHGVAPGVVMGMVKSAARMQLSSPESSDALLERLNTVLHPIKKSEMFVTFAYLAWNGERLEFSLAGHPPILHYHAATKQVSEVTCSNLPVGMFRGQRFVTGSVLCEPDDLFLLFTDGLLEVTNSKDEEFGLDAVKHLIAVHGDGPLNVIPQAILDANNRHGRADDDRSMLLVRSHLRT